jgi:hypothetical protein
MPRWRISHQTATLTLVVTDVGGNGNTLKRTAQLKSRKLR